MDLLDGAENIGDACNSTVELTEGDLRDRYSYNIGKGVLSEGEIAELPQSIQKACELKIIRFVVTIPTTTPPGNGTIVNPEGCPPPPTPGCAKPKVCFYSLNFLFVILFYPFRQFAADQGQTFVIPLANISSV